jgi:hypothetical protein
MTTTTTTMTTTMMTRTVPALTVPSLSASLHHHASLTSSHHRAFSSLSNSGDDTTISVGDTATAIDKDDNDNAFSSLGLGDISGGLGDINGGDASDAFYDDSVDQYARLPMKVLSSECALLLNVYDFYSFGSASALATLQLVLPCLHESQLHLQQTNKRNKPSNSD